MGHVSFADWPLVRVDVGAGADEPDGAALFDALARGLDREETFALVVVMPLVPPPRHRPDIKRMAWLKRNKPRVGERCAGIAFVLPSPEMRAQAPPLDRAAKVFGCQVEGFETEPPARAWASGRLNATAATDGAGNAA
jgi:hypothetical protein